MRLPDMTGRKALVVIDCRSVHGTDEVFGNQKPDIVPGSEPGRSPEARR